MQDFIVIGLLSFAAVWLIRDVPGTSRSASFLKHTAACIFVLCMLLYYVTYMSDAPAYELTCDQCSKSFVTDDPSASRLCADCSSAAVQEQLDHILEENPDLDGRYSRTATCGKCGKTYLELKILTSKSDDAPKLCKDCMPDPLSQEAVDEGQQRFLEGLQQNRETPDPNSR